MDTAYVVQDSPRQPWASGEGLWLTPPLHTCVMALDATPLTSFPKSLDLGPLFSLFTCLLGSLVLKYWLTARCFYRVCGIRGKAATVPKSHPEVSRTDTSSFVLLRTPTLALSHRYWTADSEQNTGG